MKECCECKISLNINLFSKDKNKKDGLNNRCKSCCSVRNKKRYLDKKEHIKESTLNYYYDNKEKILEGQKLKPSYHKQNPQYYKDYREKNSDKLKNYYKKWRKDNKPSYSLRIQVWWWIKKRGLSKNNRTEDLLGYSFKEFEKKIGKPLYNQHLDHKIPVSWFKSHTPIDLLFNLENLHYIGAKENREKSNCYNHPITEDYKKQIKGYIKNKYKNRL